MSCPYFFQWKELNVHIILSKGLYFHSDSKVDDLICRTKNVCLLSFVKGVSGFITTSRNKKEDVWSVCLFLPGRKDLEIGVLYTTYSVYFLVRLIGFRRFSRPNTELTRRQPFLSRSYRLSWQGRPVVVVVPGDSGRSDLCL